MKFEKYRIFICVYLFSMTYILFLKLKILHTLLHKSQNTYHESPMCQAVQLKFSDAEFRVFLLHFLLGGGRISLPEINSGNALREPSHTSTLHISHFHYILNLPNQYPALVSGCFLNLTYYVKLAALPPGKLLQDVSAYTCRLNQINKDTHTCALGFPRGTSDEESACQCRRRGFNLWIRKIHRRRAWQATPLFLPGRSWWVTVHGVAESDKIEGLRTDTHIHIRNVLALITHRSNRVNQTEEVDFLILSEHLCYDEFDTLKSEQKPFPHVLKPNQQGSSAFLIPISFFPPMSITSGLFY